MPNIAFGDFAWDDAGAAVVGATVNLYDRNTTTPVRATTTTDSTGYWVFSHATEGRFDVEIVSGSTKRRIKYDTQAQMESLEVAALRVRNPAETFEYDIVPGAITADRQLDLPVLTGTDTVVVRDLAQTLTTKRITKRIGTTADSATPTPAGDDVDMYTVTALAQAATFGAPTGTPTNGQTLIIRIKDNATARALSWNAIYRASSDLALPTTTVLSKTLYCGFCYNSADSKWDLLALLNNF